MATRWQQRDEKLGSLQVPTQTELQQVGRHWDWLWEEVGPVLWHHLFCHVEFVIAG